MRRRLTVGLVPPLAGHVLAAAQADLAAPTVAPCARVDAMLAAGGLAPGSNWNAAAVSLWVAESARLCGWPQPPVSGGDASAIVAQLQLHGRFMSRAELDIEQIQPGLLCATVYNGVTYVGVVDHVANRVAYTIEGQAGEHRARVAFRTAAFDLPSFLGVGIV